MNSFHFLENELEMPSIDQIKIAFEKFDENSKKKINKVYKFWLNFILKIENGAIEFGEFVNILKSANQTSEECTKVSCVSNKQTNNETNNISYDFNQFNNDYTDLVTSNMKLIFEQFDKDNDGKITKHELSFVMCNLFPDEEITENDINGMLKAADLDNNGFIDFEGKFYFFDCCKYILNRILI